MSHEIEKHDNVVLHKQSAWHGLGIVVADAPTPTEALNIAGLDWTVDQVPLYAQLNGKQTKLDSHVLNVRSDTQTKLGIVGKDYKAIQNHDLADFCESLAENNDVVTIESAGSIRNGEKVWFLLKGESFSVRNSDEITPYICVSNGHNGKTALRVTPTTVRVVCSNTLHMVIPRAEKEGRIDKLAQADRFIAFHNGDVKNKVQACKQALQLYSHSLEKTREVIDTIAAREINSEKVKQFFLECYTRDFGSIPTEAGTKKEKRIKNAAMDAFELFEKRFEAEKNLAGTTVWNAFNAYTGFVQHDRKTVNWKSESKRQETDINRRLFGVDTDRTNKTLAHALSI